MNKLMLKSAGYTIIESLLVLAVTGALFIIAATFVNGRQQKVQYVQAVQDFNNKLEDILNDVSVGYFPETAVKCTESGSTPNFSTSGSVQGQNKDCVFLGKSVQVGVDCDASDHKTCTKVDFYTIAGLAKITDSTGASVSPTSVTQSVPRATNLLAETYEIQWGVYIDNVVRATSGPGFTATGRQLAFITDIADVSASGDSVSVYSVSGTTVNDLTRAAAISMFNNSGSLAIDTAATAICLKDPSSDRVSAVVLNKNAQSTRTVLAIDDPEGYCS